MPPLEVWPLKLRVRCLQNTKMVQLLGCDFLTFQEQLSIPKAVLIGYQSH